MARNVVDRIADTYEGKLAEMAFRSFLSSEHRIEIDLDFEIYEGTLVHDGGQDVAGIRRAGEVDYRPAGLKVDIKATRSYSQWLLVESHKFWADVYICVKVNLPSHLESDLNAILQSAKSDIQCDVVGYVHKDSIAFTQNSQMTGVIPFLQGERLFRTRHIKNLEAMRDTLSPAEMKHEIQSLLDSAPRFGPIMKAKENFGWPISWLNGDWDELIKTLL